MRETASSSSLTSHGKDSQGSGAGDEKLSTIHLPQGYDPLQALESVEGLSSFCLKVSRKFPQDKDHKVGWNNRQ